MKKLYKFKDLRGLLLVINVIFALYFIVLPIINMLKYAFFYNGQFIGLYNFKKYMLNDKLYSSIVNSFKVSISSSILAMILAFLFVYGIKRTNIRLKRFFKCVPLILFSIPTLVHGIALICIFGKKGIMNQVFLNNIDIYGKYGIIICNVLYIFPVISSLLFVAFEVTDYRLYEVADMMGTKEIKKFFTITLPSMKFTLVNAFFSAFTLVFTDFGAAKVIGGNYNLLSIDIYEQIIGKQNFSMGAVAGIILMIPSFMFILIEYLIFKRKRFEELHGIKYTIKGNKVRDIFFQIYNLTILFIIIFEIVTIIFMSLVKSWPYNMSFTLDWYKVKSYGTSIGEIYFNTIFVSIITAIIGTIIVFIAAYLVERNKNNFILKKVNYFLYKIPLILPGLTLGLAYILFFNNPNNPLNFIYGTFIIIIIANIIHFFSIPFLNIISNLRNIDDKYECVSEILGIPWYINMIKVIIPLSMTSIIETFLYYFLNSMITVSAIIFLYTSSTRVAAIEIVNKSDIGDLQAACAIALIIIFTNLVLRIFAEKINSKYKNIER
ncbi:putative 2-aminoethylphosphonate ABC transporter permease subunit [Clostridiaceae bacterium 14S0207]|nr:putative 2-aminoethylphosphonate ABC transporter permease subunit [Clostridiaceae bacterium 14S0207]